MGNTSESPETKEQAKSAASPTRSRSARPKTENATTSNQEQERRPATARRTTTTTTTARAQSSAARPAAPTTTADAPQRSQNSADKASASATGATRSEGPPPTTSPRTSSAPRSPDAARPTPMQRNSGTPGTTAHTHTQRPAGEGVPGQRSSGGGTPGQRPSGEGVPGQRSSGGGTPGQRPSGGYAPGQRSSGGGFSGQRPSGGYAPGQRSSGGGFSGQRPSGGTAPRPGARPGGPGGSNGRPGNQTRPTGTRPAARSGTPAQRPQERRVAAVKEKFTGPISIPPQIVVRDLAELLHTSANEVIRGLIKHSIFASINQVVDYDKAALVAQDLGFEPSQSALTVAPAVQRRTEGQITETLSLGRQDANMVPVPPVVTIMGHVDHGKTSLLDMIRKTKVAAGEAGGITQHIGAYQVEVGGKKITFLDTPGHEAFTAMRARGAQVTDIAIIVVAADDGVMPQTREAIDHARAAKVPIIIALNKMDKLDANPDHVKQQLAEIGVVVEEYGGDVVCVPVSARKGTGIDEMLEMILLVAEMQEIRANPNRPATGIIIEAKLEKNTGALATVLIQQGTLKMGDNIVVGSMAGKVRAMFNDRGKRIQKAPPSTPVSILGLPEVPQAGDRLEVVSDERTARQSAAKVAEQRRDESMPLGQVSLDTLYMQMQEGKVKELNLVLKCDVQGSAEAIKNALSKIGEENLKVRLIHEGIGNINETDVHLAAASGAIVIGFNVKADGAAQRQAQKEGVDIRYYNIIYKLTDDIQAALTGMLEPTYREVIDGHAEVQQIFKAGKNTVIAGCRVLDGKITRSSQVRVLRKKEKVYDGQLSSLRRGRDDVREVNTGYECGIVLDDFTDFEVEDMIETYAKERVKPGT